MVDSSALDEQLRRFEEAIDQNDPEQIKLLQEMKDHTRRLHQARGDWNKPSTFRNWNAPPPRKQAPAPLAIESYRHYKNYIEKETLPIEMIAQGHQPRHLEPGSGGGGPLLLTSPPNDEHPTDASDTQQ